MLQLMQSPSPTLYQVTVGTGIVHQILSVFISNHSHCLKSQFHVTSQRPETYDQNNAYITLKTFKVQQ
jgi:hypothetical protein